MLFINVEDYEQINALYLDAYLGPAEDWEEAADKLYDKLLNMRLSDKERDNLIMNIKKINRI